MAIKKLSTVKRLSRELQQRYTFAEIQHIFDEYGIAYNTRRSWSSKWVFAEEALNKVDWTLLGRLADELQLTPLATLAALADPPNHWADTHRFRLFISHLAKDKDVYARRLRDCLLPYCISGFIAHEDIEPTKDWQQQIVKALHCMEAFVAIHTKGFRDSVYTQQEVGFALGKGVPILSLRIDEDPCGLIAGMQAIPRRGRDAVQLAAEIDRLLSRDDRTRSSLKQAKKRVQ